MFPGYSGDASVQDSAENRQSLHALLTDALDRADQLELARVAVKISGAIDELQRSNDRA